MDNNEDNESNQNEEEEDLEEIEEPTMEDVEIEELAEFTEPIDVEEMFDGPTTLFVGNFSAKCKTVNAALEYVCTSNDRIVVLPFLDDVLNDNPQGQPNTKKLIKNYDGDVVVDTTKFKGVKILGATRKNRLEVKEPPRGDDEEDKEDEEEIDDMEDEDVDEAELKRRKKKLMAMKMDTTLDNLLINGRLILVCSEGDPTNMLATGYSESEEEREDDSAKQGEEESEGANNDEKTENNEDAELKDNTPKNTELERAPGLLIDGINFITGCECQVKTFAYVQNSSFGGLVYDPNVAINTKLNALNTVEFTSCRFFGSNKSAIYCFPFSHTRFIDCDIIGSKKLDKETAQRKIDDGFMVAGRLPRGYVPPPPPVPSVPTTVCCETGIYSDDSAVYFSNADISYFGIGLYSVNKNKEFRLEDSRISEIQTVGVFIEQHSEAIIKDCVVKLCGRETLLVGGNGQCHPTIRDCVFMGEVRLKDNVISTGISDNKIIVPSGTMLRREMVVYETEEKVKQAKAKGFGLLSTMAVPVEKIGAGDDELIFLSELDKNGQKNKKVLVNEEKMYLIKGFNFTNKEPPALSVK